MSASALGFDFAGPAQWEISVSERGLVADLIPAWAGVRLYDGVREFRDPAQLKTPGFLRTLALAPLALGHPRDQAGRFLFFSALAESEGSPLEWSEGQAVGVPHRDLQVGTLGDAVTFVEVDGLELPKVRAVITSPKAIAMALGGGGMQPRREVSLGFVKHRITEPGVWVAPDGTEYPYDVEQVLDPDDPRVPENLQSWVGANYLGVGFGQGESRGEYTRLGVDAAERPDGRKPPRTFFLIRQGDETGVSGTGHVLDGVVWPDGKVVTKWCAEGSPSEINVAESFAQWDSIHVSKHPTNRSLILFDDGGEPPSPDIEDNPPETDQGDDMTPEEMAKKIQELEAAFAERDAMIAKLKEAAAPESDSDEDPAAAEELAAKKEELAKAQASMDAKDRELAKLHAEVAPMRKAQRDAKIAEVAKRAGVDAKTLEGVAVADLEVAAMKGRLAAGLDGHIAEDYRDNPTYLKAAYDLLPAKVSTSEVSSGFAAAVGADSNPSANPAKAAPANEFDALP